MALSIVCCLFVLVDWVGSTCLKTPKIVICVVQNRSYGHTFGCCTQQGAFEFHVNFFGHTLRLEVDEERPCAKLQGEKGIPFSGPKIGPQLVVDFPSVGRGNDPQKGTYFRFMMVDEIE
jgi:hypothetical protein